MNEKLQSRILVWTGFRGKSLWDWMSLLMIPVVVSGMAAWFQMTTENAVQNQEDKRAVLQRELAVQLEDLQRESEDKRAVLQRELAKELEDLQRESEEKRSENLLEVESDRNRSEVLRNYLDKISELMIENGLASSDAPSSVRNVARARTLVALKDLDQPRKSQLMQFLNYAQLSSAYKDNPAISFEYAELTDIDLSEVDMWNINLTRANLNEVDVSGAKLGLANLTGASLIGANLSRADLFQANLFQADLDYAKLNDVRKLTVEQLCSAQSLFKIAGLALELMEQVKEQCPHLLEKPNDQ